MTPRLPAETRFLEAEARFAAISFILCVALAASIGYYAGTQHAGPLVVPGGCPVRTVTAGGSQ